MENSDKEMENPDSDKQMKKETTWTLLNVVFVLSEEMSSLCVWKIYRLLLTISSVRQCVICLISGRKKEMLMLHIFSGNIKLWGS
jgi:hypothetical protein